MTFLIHFTALRLPFDLEDLCEDHWQLLESHAAVRSTGAVILTTSEGSQETRASPGRRNTAPCWWLPGGEEESWGTPEGRGSQDFWAVCEFLQPEVLQEKGGENKLLF